MSSIIDRVRETMDPQSAANALYEIMLLWHAMDQAVRGAPRRQRPIHEGKRDAFEQSFGLFLGIGPRQARELLRKHFNGSGAEHGRNIRPVERTGQPR